MPPPGDAARRKFHHWSVFIVAALYPTWTYGDDPPKWTGDNAGAARLRETTEARRKELWAQAEAAAGSPWFLGERLSAIDLYVAVMTNWRPGRKWFTAHTPRLHAIAQKPRRCPRSPRCWSATLRRER